MNLEFSLDNVKAIEFGVGREDGGAESYVTIPVGAKFQSALREVAVATWNELQSAPEGPERFEPSEKYGGIERVYLPIEDDLAKGIRQLHESAGFHTDVSALTGLDSVFCYFTRLEDGKDRRLTGLRRAAQFKGVSKQRNRLARQLDNTLDIIGDTVFKLDNDFDMLIDSANVHILRPKGFEFVGKLQEAILEAVSSNVDLIRKDLPFVDFERVEEYARKRPRAARYLASIRSQSWAKGVNKELLRELCEKTGVKVHEYHGHLDIAPGNEMGFLEVLDRRRYEINLAEDGVEKWRASGRSRIND